MGRAAGPGNVTADLSEFLRYSRPRRKTCIVGVALQVLPPAEKKQLEAAVVTDQGIITASAIQKWLEKRGHSTTAAAIAVHRRNQCSCSDQEG